MQIWILPCSCCPFSLFFSLFLLFFSYPFYVFLFFLQSILPSLFSSTIFLLPSFYFVFSFVVRFSSPWSFCYAGNDKNFIITFVQGILENMMEIKADISEIIADNIHFMPWLLRRIQVIVTLWLLHCDCDSSFNFPFEKLSL